MKSLKILSFNIHKGFTTTNRKFVLDGIKQSIQEAEADILCLQEVLGHHDVHSKKIKNMATSSQLEFLADQMWPHMAYGKNAVYSKGHHGNAILSKFPISSWHNQNVSTLFERRGLLHAKIDLVGSAIPLHVYCVHLGLLERDRRQQISLLIKNIFQNVPADSPLIVAGDFNDWKKNATSLLKDELNLQESFLQSNGNHAITFPAWLPMLSLDRIYYRNMRCVSTQVLRRGIWSKLSDHLALATEFEFDER